MDYNCHSHKRVSLPNRFWVKLLIPIVWWWPTSVEILKSEIQWKENISSVSGCGQTPMGEIELKGKKCIHFLACPSNISIDLCQEGSRIHSHDFTSLHGKRTTFSFKLKDRINPTWRGFNAIATTEVWAEVRITQVLSRVLCAFLKFLFGCWVGHRSCMF